MVETAEDIIEGLNLEVRKDAKRENSPPAMSPREREILESIDKQTQIEQLAIKTGLEQSLLLPVLTSLTLKGLIRELPGKFFERE